MTNSVLSTLVAGICPIGVFYDSPKEEIFISSLVSNTLSVDSGISISSSPAPK